MMNKCTYILLLLVLLPCHLFAQTNQNAESLLEGYGRFRERVWREYTEFRQKCNMDYANFMKHAWVEYGVQPPVPAPKQKKRIKPISQSVSRPTDAVCIVADEVEMLPMDTVQPVPIKYIPSISEIKYSYKDLSFSIESDIGEVALQRLLPSVEVKKHGGLFRFLWKKKKEPSPEVNEQPSDLVEEEESLLTMTDLRFTFYGTEMSVPFPENFKFVLPDCSNQTLSDTWKLLSTPRFGETIRGCLLLRHQHQMCDWAYVEMLRTMSETYFGKDSNEAVFLAAYIYCQTGYKTRLARNDNKLYMLVASEQFIYDHSYIYRDGQDFFTVQKVDYSTTLEVCDASFMEEKRLTMFIPKSLKLNPKRETPRIIKSTADPRIAVSVAVDRNVIKFYNQYPKLRFGDNDFIREWAMYANTPLNEDVKEQLYPILRNLLDSLTVREGVQTLMRLIQTGLEYGDDNTAWGSDRAFFAEETLYYPKCDCEDKSILFSRLVRDLYGLKAMLVYMEAPNAEDHMCTAVNFKEDISGYYIADKYGAKYYYCDPTWGGLSIGDAPSGYTAGKNANILLENDPTAQKWRIQR